MTDPCRHIWARIETGRMVLFRYLRNGERKKRKVPEVKTLCTICGAHRPKPQRVVTLRVLNRRVECPYGFNDEDGQRNLHDCYLDSITPGHRCVDPEGSGATRCPQVAKWHALYGWRTFYRVAAETVAYYGVLHKEYPLQIAYSAMNTAGTLWFATNVKTGQRYAVVLDSGQRRTPEGELIELEYKMVDSAEYDRRIARGGTVNIPYLTPIWSGVPPRDEWRGCDCITCQERNRSHTGAIMSSAEYEHLSGLKIIGPVQDKPLLKASELPSAGMDQKPIGDPTKCEDCKFARCRIHRMIVRPAGAPRVVPPMSQRSATLQRVAATRPIAKRPASTSAPKIKPTEEELPTKASILTKKIKKAASQKHNPKAK